MTSIASLIREKLDANGRLPCKEAIALSTRIGVPKTKIGRVCKEQGISISDCELGLFGVLSETMNGVLSSDVFMKTLTTQSEGNTLSCERLQELAKQAHIQLIQAAKTALKAGIVITPCDLGCF